MTVMTVMMTAGTLGLVEASPVAAANHHTVVNCNHNPNALTSALISPQPGETLVIKGVCFGNFVINTNLTLIGLKDAVLDGHDTGTTVTINGAFRVELKNLTITHGSSSSNGGGILNNGGTVTLSGSTVRNNAVTGSSNGGGGIENNHGTLKLNQSTVRNNMATGTFGFGGGIDDNHGTTTLNHSTVSNNTATFVAGGIETNQTKLTLDQSTVSNNSAAFIGGMDLSGVTSTLTMSDSTVKHNSAAGNTFSDVGGIEIESGTTATLYRSRVLDNTAATDSGGIFNAGATTLNQSTVSGNIAGTVGGGIGNRGNLTLRHSEVERNTAFSDGGGIFKFSGTVTLQDSKVRHNHPNNCAPPNSVPGCRG
ncbi:hypothetical protein [Streptomyces hygroscopicus]|uniref:hypothetical protein n=1 Tax=Streptomyces hygroscopicus TaxID=1912 RepID=UPI00223FC5F9|nr:hypothetical protein [Streptomyces hygroscopicus]